MRHTVRKMSGLAAQLVAAAVPHVDGAPCLGGHNRGELPAVIATPEAAAAYLESLSTQPDTRRCEQSISHIAVLVSCVPFHICTASTESMTHTRDLAYSTAHGREK